MTAVKLEPESPLGLVEAAEKVLDVHLGAWSLGREACGE